MAFISLQRCFPASAHQIVIDYLWSVNIDDHIYNEKILGWDRLISTVVQTVCACTHIRFHVAAAACTLWCEWSQKDYTEWCVSSHDSALTLMCSLQSPYCLLALCFFIGHHLRSSYTYDVALFGRVSAAVSLHSRSRSALGSWSFIPSSTNWSWKATLGYSKLRFLEDGVE